MKIKIHMLNVGEADAIIVELIDPYNNELRLLIDGGLEKHARTIIDYFKQINTKPDILICSHLDKDHVGGLRGVVEEYKDYIKAIWVHLPENHDGNLRKSVIEKAGLNERSGLILASINDLKNFIEVARKYKIKIFEPFSDSLPQEVQSICSQFRMRILGPSIDFYNKLVVDFKEDFNSAIIDSKKDIIEYVIAATKNPCANLGSSKDRPENESSLIFEISTFYKKFLFTGDAGLIAFNDIKSKLAKVYWLKVPHHGSKGNLNSEVIEVLKPQRSFIPADGIKHPDSELVNCLKSHGSEVKCTCEASVLIEEVR
jgi:beta-lactamase superfamily II metal-dependent hydrolase